MGQGFSLTTASAGSAGIDVPELRDVVYEKSLGSARFMKSIRARHHDGVVLVKVLVKPYTPMPLGHYRTKILAERKALADIPNTLGYQRVIETETNGYLVRQFLYNSLYDRISTRPFLEDIEKKWLAFQLLCALRDCHSKDIYHGDIKTENTLVTSWNWLYLTDFSSSFKPIMLPDDNPADFSYFFDTSGRRTCYLAPERFIPPGETYDKDAKLTWAMDVFSAGCVIAELFLESPFFSLSQLYRYRKGEYDPAISHLSRIPDKGVREMIGHMIQLDPQKRYSAEQYLDFYRKKVFPDYFYSFLHQYMEVITNPASAHAPASSSGELKNTGEADERIDRVYYDFDKISYFLGYKDDKKAPTSPPVAPRLGLAHLPVRLNIPNNEHYASLDAQPPPDNGSLIFLTLVVASLRNTARTASRVRACDVLLAFAERLTDEAKLDRVLPYLMALLNDKSDIVVVTAIRTITQLLSLVQVVNPVNAHVFLEYILPRMSVALQGQSDREPPNLLVRATYASCLGSLASTANRFLEIAATLKDRGSIPADPEVESGYAADTGFDDLIDDAHRELVDLFEAHTKMVIEDPDPFVRRAFLSSVPELCMFFGGADANDIIVTHLNTYLNDPDWMLRCALFDSIVGIAVFLGSVSLEAFILPLMIQALTDPEEHVVASVLDSLAELAGLALFSKEVNWELVTVVSRFTMHPNAWIREAAARFLASCATFLSDANRRCRLMPLITPYLKKDIIPEPNELSLLDDLKKPMSRAVFDQTMNWALKTDRGIFWKPLSKLRSFTFGAFGGGGREDLSTQSLSRIPKNDEDEQWLNRLRGLGLTQEDEFKLLALREFIWRLSRIKLREGLVSQENAMPLNGIISTKEMGLRPVTILFDEPLKPQHIGAAADLPPRSIEDALQDASMTIDDPVSKRRRAALNAHRSRLSSNNNGAHSPTSVDGRIPLDEGLSRSPTDAQPRTSIGTQDNTLSPTSATSRRGLRHQSSAMSLLNRKESVKSGAETGMNETNAIGQVGGPVNTGLAPTSPTLEANPETNSQLRFRQNHSYAGNDPTVLKMLDDMYIDNYPHDVLLYGPLVTPINRRKASRPSTQVVQEAWKPAGRVVATFTEHTGAINRVIVSPDHVFFLTGGDDGTVRVWDTLRLERNISHRSRQTHRHAPSARVLALCFVENTHSFVSCASDGSVHIVKVECGSAFPASNTAPTTYRYNKLKTLREYQFPEGEFAVWCEHYKHEAASILLLATNRSRILAIDIRRWDMLFTLENPTHHGAPTCFAVDRRRNWLAVGTSHGVVDLWDLRFRMRLKGWGLPGSGAIYRMAIHPVKGRGKWLCVAGGTGQGEVTVWDLEKTLCREVYRVGGNKSGPKGFEAWDVDEERPEGMLGRFATRGVEPASAADAGSAAGNGSAGSAVGSSTDRGVRAMVVGSSPLDEARDVRHAFVVTGGSDKKLRFWDLARVENSVVFSGLQPDEGRSTFASMQVTTAMTMNTERPGGSGAAGGKGGEGKDGKGRVGKSVGRPSRSTVISLQQQQLLRSHLDAVLDVGVLESPYPMVVSVDRSGVVFVFS